MKDWEQITQLLGMQCSVQQGRNKYKWRSDRVLLAVQKVDVGSILIGVISR